MKCEHCGHPLNIEDKFCPACGQPNTFATKHQQDMETYKEDYEKTKQDVIKKAGGFSGYTVPIIILAALLIITVISGVVYRRAWSIGYDIQRNNIEANADTYITEAKTYLDSGDYVGFAEYWDEYSLYNAESLREYNAIDRAAGEYASLFKSIISEDYKIYNEDDYYITQMCSDLNDLFNVEKDYTYDKEIYLSEDKIKIIEDMRDKALNLVATFAGISYDEAKQLTEMSESRQREFLKERLQINEE